MMLTFLRSFFIIINLNHICLVGPSIIAYWTIPFYIEELVCVIFISILYFK